MGEIMFGNEFFDKWLHQKTDEILEKVDREKITTEEMLILSLKAQTNHFHHIDTELRAELKSMDSEFRGEFKKIDKRFDRLTTIMMWQGGVTITLISGLYLKTFFGH